MASKQKTAYVCSACGYRSPKWNGQCPDCGEWNTLEEEIQQTSSPSKKNVSADGIKAFRLQEIEREYRIDKECEHRLRS